MKHHLLVASIMIFIMAGTTAFGLDKEETPTPTGALLGFVMITNTLLPVAEAHVTVMPGSRVTQTNAMGTFLLDDLPYGSYGVVITAAGYTNYYGIAEVSSPIVNVITAPLVPLATSEEGEPEPTGTLTGFITDAQALLPVEGASITLSPGDHSASSTGFGTFFISDLAYGAYTLEATASGYEPATQSIDISGTLPQAITIMMAPEDTGEPSGAGVIAGYVSNASTGAPLANAEVVLQPGDTTVATNDFGAFTFLDVDYGDYTLGASANGYETAETDVTVDSALHVVNMALQPDVTIPTGAIAGIVTRDGLLETPVPGITVTLMPDDISTTTNALGAYLFSGLEYGDYTLHFSGEGYETRSVEVTVETEEVQTVNVMLTPVESDPVGIVAGLVLDTWSRTPVEGATVTLMPGNIAVQTSVMGEFLFDGLAYGTYTVTAEAAGYQTTEETVEVDGTMSSVTSLLLTPEEGEPMGVVTGVVINANTELPVANARVVLSPGDEERLTGNMGTFTFANVAYGDYDLEAEAAGYTLGSAAVTVSSPLPPPVVLALTPSDTVNDEGEGEGEGESEDEGEDEGESEEEGEGESNGEGEQDDDNDTTDPDDDNGDSIDDEDMEGQPGCCLCRNEAKSKNWLFWLKEYWLLAAAMIFVYTRNKRTH